MTTQAAFDSYVAISRRWCPWLAHRTYASTTGKGHGAGLTNSRQIPALHDVFSHYSLRTGNSTMCGILYWTDILGPPLMA